MSDEQTTQGATATADTLSTLSTIEGVDLTGDFFNEVHDTVSASEGETPIVAEANQETKKPEEQEVKQAGDAPDSPVAEKADATIPTFDAALLAQAAMRNIPESVATKFSDPAALQAFLATLPPVAPSATLKPEEKPAQPAPEAKPAAEPLFKVEPFTLTPEQRENFDEDTLAVLDGIIAHNTQQLAKFAAAMDPVAKTVSTITMTESQRAVAQAVDAFDNTVNGLTEFSDILGTSKPAPDTQAYQLRSRAFDEAQSLMEELGGKVEPAEIVRRAALIALVKSGIPYTPPTAKPKAPPARDTVLEKLAEQQSQALGRPQSSVSPLGTHIQAAAVPFHDIPTVQLAPDELFNS